MTGLDFFVDLAVTGTALGLDHTSDLAEVDAVFDTYHQELSPRSLLTGSGLLEFGWNRRHERDDWSALWFGAQAHRLRFLTGEDDEVEPRLVARYGEFPAILDIDELLAAVTDRGYRLEQVPDGNEGCVAYWSPVSDMHVLATDRERPDQSLPPGMVLKVLGPRPWWPWNRFAGREPEFARYVEQLLPLSAVERSAWLDTHDPSDDHRRDWWGCLTNMVWRKGDRHDLVVALHREAGERGVCTPAEAAIAEIGELVAAHGRGHDVAPADDAVRRWLAHVPPSGDVRSDRVLRNQIHEVRQGVTHLADPALADAVRPWLQLRPALLGDGRAPRVAAD